MKSNMIRAQAALLGMTDKDVAVKMGMPQPTFSRKMNGSSEFSIEEVKALTRALNLNGADIIRIFFED